MNRHQCRIAAENATGLLSKASPDFGAEGNFEKSCCTSNAGFRFVLVEL